MIPRGAPYIAWSDLLAAAWHCAVAGDARVATQRVEERWAPNTVLSLSVRSGLDALLQVLALPPNSEIIVSAITIPHILDIIARHRLVAVPVDVDMNTLAVDPAAVRRAVTRNTKAILVAHLFGSRMPLDEISVVARQQQLLLIEDCAQANDGSSYRGHADSDVSMFSFGLIKRQTALGGGLLRFKNPTLAQRVREKQAAYPRQSRRAYFRRVLTMAAMKFVGLRPVFQMFVVLCKSRGRDHDKTLGTALRAFSGGDLFVRLRQQPSGPLVRLLERRLKQPALEPIAQRVALVEAVTTIFPELNRPGAAANHHTHWLFPMLTPDPERLMRHLWKQGFDATCGASNLLFVPAPDGHPRPAQSIRLMTEVLYLPLFPGATKHEMQKLAAAVREHETSSQRDWSLTAVS
ncbi:MAG TPA: DegT/DnrJ/EryC1/StrS family aminotransferase [Gemmatimonadaceae bacterium]|nr:DegT/DnrJ/EryC1/StrS family aminotransferase [Gemmatimonadaceae bacterium]